MAAQKADLGLLGLAFQMEVSGWYLEAYQL
jgi:hypothetical protein